MGTNGPRFDTEKHLASKSMNELISIRDEMQGAVDRNPQIKTFNEYLQLVKGKIAERIGKK